MTTGYTPINAIKAARKLNEHTNSLSKTFEKLSSGLRINRASDDAAGLAVAEDLKTDSRVYGQAIRNANDAISSLSIADGALGELDNLLGRLKELSEQSANGVYSLTQRKALDTEAQQLVQEYNRITASTKFNGTSILAAGQGEMRIQLGYGVAGSIGYAQAGELDRNINSGTFESAIANGIGMIAGLSGTADFNGDGMADLYGISNLLNNAEVSISDGDGTFTTTNFNEGTTILGSAAADFDGNGTVDFVVTSANGAHFYSGDGDGTFTSGTTSSGGVITNPQIGDFNGDGIVDLLGTSGTNIVLSTGNGDGSFNTAQTVLAAGVAISSVRAGDFNGDGTDDFAYSSSAVSSIGVYTGSTTGSFTNTGTLTAAAVSAGIRIGDINRDGLDDLVVSSSNTIYTGTANSNGTISSLTSTGITGASTFRLADMNSDGALDILALNGTSLSYYTGNDDGSFNASSGSTSTVAAQVLMPGDYNGDGAMDVVVTRTTASVKSTLLGNTTQVNTMQGLYLLDEAGARAALTTVEAAQTRVANERGKIGANLSRLDSAMANIESLRANTQNAHSRIMDIDVAEETANMIKLQVLQNGAQAVGAQANLSAKTVLEMLNF